MFRPILKQVCAMLALASAPALAAQTDITVYTALEADQIKAYQAAFEREYPDIKIHWVRDSTGIITAKLLAEKNNPKADVVWGLAGTSLGLMDKEGMLEAYAPKGLDQISANMRDSREVPAWVGMDAFTATICFNTIEAEKQKLPKPTSWQDLTRPEYAGKIVMPNPASSGTGFLDVSAWLQMFGEEKGWAFMDGLHKNIGSYTHSGSKPCNLAAAGEFPIGISFDYRGAKLKADGAPIELIFPSEGLGWEVEATAIMRGTKHPEAARKVADFSASRAANELYKANFAVLAIPAVATSNPNLPANLAERMIKNDFVWAATQRERILAEWAKRYDGKSEAKKP
ncbi:putative 2-aminoethylphosphonate ABC transporter substrate-binding protein [Bordetella trematum]|uniref:ABC transporter periplasmic binding protein n=2 Tax=Bordetella trematum TaxID=123899 RepID=A0A157SLA4_9BORD|nr:putative 2-aminoethylphosphonate ABC transporter substrate-binding protein [Bordetella trematum]AZR93565.1 putative 2-aminoethylphosphonate ABC transporter substrate-binding protein [Bordetella trematum]NNH17626.1 putative 2-aminoethylphosphonate ABC transporter substrate-binding protein [Bordetella trematum]QIM72147.1 putative 2-aminoethylphosphonate ABC transporter substrate-binding protein [Bordetella trematum]SAI60965.1 ABC transporter periplasmic binding protein [Bordetella trematum]